MTDHPHPPRADHQHDPQHGHEPQDPTQDPTAFWEDRYGSKDQIWSGKVNPILAIEAASLHPATALDLGCGEGGDALWLAEQGWSVTAVDISATAIARGRDAAIAAGLAGSIDWQRHELGSSFPDGSFDLISAQFLQSPVALDRTRILRTAAEAVAPGGVLLSVSHAAFPPWAPVQDPTVHFPTPEEELAALELPEHGWEVVRCEIVERVGTSPDGHTGNLLDAVLLVRRLA